MENRFVLNATINNQANAEKALLLIAFAVTLVHAGFLVLAAAALFQIVSEQHTLAWSAVNYLVAVWPRVQILILVPAFITWQVLRPRKYSLTVFLVNFILSILALLMLPADFAAAW